MDIEKLKQKILDLAIRGKLVPQDPNDEPASVLIEKIRKEKEELIKQGKIKRDKNESYIYKGSDNCYYEKIGSEVKNITDELPFEIPTNWTWCKLKTVLDVRDGTHDSPKYYSEGIPFVTSKCLKNNTIDFSLCKLISLEDAKKFNERSYVDDKDILFAMIGTIGNATIVNKDREFSIKNVALFKNINRNLLSEKYIKYILDCLTNKMIEKTSSGLQPFVSLDFLRNYIVPIPPIQEQINIVNKLDFVFEKLMIIKKDRNKLISLIDNAKSKILDYYFGENSCYKSYFMNKSKEHLKNFIPSKYIGDGDWVLSENMDPNGSYKLIQLKHIGNNVYLDKPYNTVNREFVNQNNCSIITSGTLLINRLVADRMNCCILPETTNKHITSVDVCWIAKNDIIDNEYLMYLLSSPSFQSDVMNKCSGSTRKRISKKNLLDIKVFFHNYEYQLIIKTKIQEIFYFLDSINI